MGGAVCGINSKPVTNLLMTSPRPTLFDFLYILPDFPKIQISVKLLGFTELSIVRGWYSGTLARL